MSSLCSATCCTSGATTPPVAYDTCVESTRESTVQQFILFKCDAEFTDISDPTEWQTKITAGDISVSPVGNLVVGAPAEQLHTVSYKKKKVVGSETTMEFKTIFTADDGSDFAYFADLNQNSNGLRIAWKDASGFYYFNNAVTAAITGVVPTYDLTTATGIGESPGMEFSVTQTPHTVDATGSAEWTMTFSITEEGVRQGVLLPGVLIGC